jgi:hypothetical protein
MDWMVFLMRALREDKRDEIESVKYFIKMEETT